MKLPELNWKTYLWAFLFLGGLILVYKGLENYQAVGDAFQGLLTPVKIMLKLLSPFATGLLFAYLLHIPCEKIAYLLKKIPLKFMSKWARPLSVLCLVLIIVGFLAGVGSFVIPALQKSINDLLLNWPIISENAFKYLADLQANPYLSGVDWNDIVESPQQFLSDIDFSKITGYALDAVGAVFNFFVTIVVAIYMLLNPYPLLKTVKRIARMFVQEETYESLAVYVRKTDAIFYKFISCQLLDALIIGMISGIGLTILGVRYSVLLAVTLAILNIIPFFGAFLGVTIAAVTTLLTGGLSQALVVLVFLIILQQVDGNIIIPRLLGQSLNLNPVIIIMAITIGGTFGGVLGMFLAVPVVAVFKIILGDVMVFLENRIHLKRQPVAEMADGIAGDTITSGMVTTSNMTSSSITDDPMATDCSATDIIANNNIAKDIEDA
ncbi:MAG: AI-2E family transporter [Peptococcaceae bacterium]|jgi:predicted PurR-regulated permease PerM|nr:AI-2E family transporter [Peptococcaceae bacterium]